MLEFEKIKNSDKEVYDLIMEEYNRQNSGLELIASENVPSEAVLQAQSSYHTLKYAEGYPGARYYGGCEVIDKTEQLAIDRVCKLFGCNYANVQPHSGAQANMAVQFALCKPGDTIMGMSLNSGGHLTHGAKPTFSGKHFNAVQYEVNAENYEIDYQELENMIWESHPRLFIAGASAYPRGINFRHLRKVIDIYNEEILSSLKEEGYSDEKLDKEYEKRKCYFMVDMAHIAGLVAAELHQSPIPYADVVTSTTHKTLRGPRGGIILTNSEDLIKKINKALFPGIQGGPLENIIAAKAVCFGEALKPEFKQYQEQVIKNADTLAKALVENGFNVLTGGTSNHLILLDLKNKGITGKELETRLENVGIVSNKNAVPFDTENKKTTSGLRLGTPAVTSRGLIENDMREIAVLINWCTSPYYEQNIGAIRAHVDALCKKYPLYQD